MEKKNRDIAEKLARANAEYEPAIIEIYLFPSDEEIRLVELDPSAPSSEDTNFSPFYFPPDPSAGIPMPSAIALIPPEEKDLVNPPADWGQSWEDAVLILKNGEAA